MVGQQLLDGEHAVAEALVVVDEVEVADARLQLLERPQLNASGSVNVPGEELQRPRPQSPSVLNSQ